jgi:hypothetical protein
VLKGDLIFADEEGVPRGHPQALTLVPPEYFLGCREELLDPPDLASTVAAACSMFRGKAIRPLGFSRRGGFIGERATSGGGPGGLTTWWHGQGLGRATLWCGWPLAPLRLIFGLHEALVKIEGSAFVSSNFENISCVTFLKHKK